ncbi:hypothetical protein SAN_2093 [Streptococcus agalactiae COH1]|nr:hypothetical protein SAN_2093 [Streptococcus agalactiae COH1]
MIPHKISRWVTRTSLSGFRVLTACALEMTSFPEIQRNSRSTLRCGFVCHSNVSMSL